MTTQSTAYSETNNPSARKIPTDGRSTAETIEATVPELKAKLRHMMDSGKARVSEWQGGVQDGIREKPIQSVLIAAAVGAVIGMIISRRSR